MLYACQRTEIPGQEGYKRDSCVVDCFRHALRPFNSFNPRERENLMNSIVYLVGAVVIIIALLSFFGLR